MGYCRFELVHAHHRLHCRGSCAGSAFALEVDRSSLVAHRVVRRLVPQRRRPLVGRVPRHARPCVWRRAVATALVTPRCARSVHRSCEQVAAGCRVPNRCTSLPSLGVHAVVGFEGAFRRVFAAAAAAITSRFDGVGSDVSQTSLNITNRNRVPAEAIRLLPVETLSRR